MTSVLQILFILVLIWGYLLFFEWKNFYHTRKHIETTPAAFGLEYEDVELVSEDGRNLHGWWAPHPDARGTIIICHGNSGNIGDRVWMIADLLRLKVNVFAFDYRGYGQSKGVPTEQGTYADARAAFEVVRAKHGDAEAPPVIVFGESLGGAVAIQLAADKPVKGLLVESTFSSTVDIGKALYPRLPVRLFSRFHYDSVRKVASLTMPKLFAHSRQDDFIPFELGQKLFEAAAEPKEFVEMNGGHNDGGWMTNQEYWKAIERFVDRVFGPQTQTIPSDESAQSQ
jgi:fermentation-respiration switch protein FrsA (DUF1100 family)